ncbi:MAG: adenosylcobinamide amidohydrolase [Pseudomonadota bacterium]
MNRTSKPAIKLHWLLSLALLASASLPASSGEPPTRSVTILHETEHYQASRQGRYFVVTLKRPHLVLSTSDINGGQTMGLKTLVNFQSVEGNAHDARFYHILSLSDQQYHQELASALLLDAEKMASMGTAANINNTVHVQKSFREITVDAFVTAGISSNALRAGDNAKWYQAEDGKEFLKDAGTINVILLLNRALTAGAQAKAAAVAAEAKSAALLELAIPSTRSQHLATGTGTDQFAIASPITSSLKTMDSASGHLKLGELIGVAVREAVIQAISIQNGLERTGTRSVLHALGRFGLTHKILLSRLEKKLSIDDFALLQNNERAVFTEPKLVAAAYAYASVLDRLEYGTLSRHLENDVLIDQAVNAAIALSGASQQSQQFRARLGRTQADQLDFFVSAIAVGWEAKWQ